MTVEDAGTAVRRNENADSEPNGNDLEEVSFEVVAPPIEVNPLLSTAPPHKENNTKSIYSVLMKMIHTI